jgi:hypothetical protein
MPLHQLNHLLILFIGPWTLGGTGLFGTSLGGTT